MNTDSEAVRIANELRLVNALQVRHPTSRRITQVDFNHLIDSGGIQRRRFAPEGPDWDTDTENINNMVFELSLLIDEMPHRLIGEPIDVDFYYPEAREVEMGNRKAVGVSIRVDAQATRSANEERIMSELQEVYPVTRRHIGEDVPPVVQGGVIQPRVFMTDYPSWDTPVVYTIERIKHNIRHTQDRIVDQPIDVDFYYPTDEERSRGFVSTIKILVRTHAQTPTPTPTTFLVERKMIVHPR